MEKDAPVTLRATWRMGDIHAKICDAELVLLVTNSQLRPLSKRIEMSE